MHSFQRGGLTFQVRDSGPPRGDVVVCLHGFPQDASAYDDVASGLTGHGLRVLAPLQRGYSPGARPRARAAYAMPQLVDDVIALLNTGEIEKAHIIGHDLGGLVAWALAGRHRERVHSVTVISTPHPGAFAAAVARTTQGLRASYIGALQLPWLPERLLRAANGKLVHSTLTRSGLPRARADRYVTHLLEPGALRGALGWYRALPLATGYRTGRSRVPTGFLWGAKDPVFTRQAAGLTRRYVLGPYAERELRDAGHWIPETHPGDVVASVLETVARAEKR